jgi:hypothetical protein
MPYDRVGEWRGNVAALSSNLNVEEDALHGTGTVWIGER